MVSETLTIRPPEPIQMPLFHRTICFPMSEREEDRLTEVLHPKINGAFIAFTLGIFRLEKVLAREQGQKLITERRVEHLPAERLHLTAQEAASFTDFVNANYQLVLSHARYRYKVPPDAAEDILQELFLKMALKWKEYGCKPAEDRQYLLFTSLKHQVIDWTRHENYHQQHLDSLPENDQEERRLMQKIGDETLKMSAETVFLDNNNKYEAEEERSQLADEVQKLDHDTGKIILFKIAGNVQDPGNSLEDTEIGYVLDMSKPALRSRYARVRRRLFEQFPSLRQMHDYASFQ